MSTVVCKGIALSDIIANEEKSKCVPSQVGELLGFILDLQHGIFQVPARREEALKQLRQTLYSFCWVLHLVQWIAFEHEASTKVINMLG